MAVALDLMPRLMPAPAAARYLGVSESLLRDLGLRRRELRGKRLYDRADLDAFADSLRYEGGEDGPCKEDEIFGVGT